MEGDDGEIVAVNPVKETKPVKLLLGGMMQLETVEEPLTKFARKLTTHRVREAIDLED